MSTHGVSQYVQDHYPPNEWAQVMAELRRPLQERPQAPIFVPSPIRLQEASPLECCKITSCALLALLFVGGVVATSAKREVVLIAVESSLAVTAVCAVAICCRVMFKPRDA